MNVERLVAGAPFYMIIAIVLVAALYPAATAFDRGRVGLAAVVGVAGLAIHGAYFFAVDRLAHGYDGMTLLLVWPVVAIALSALISLVIRRSVEPRG